MLIATWPNQAYAAENLHDGESGRFFYDYCNWTRIQEFEDVVRTSEAAAVAADLMGSQSIQMFHDHVLVKEPGTSKPTPWHQDGPYYFVDGTQTISFWYTLDSGTNTLSRYAPRGFWAHVFCNDRSRRLYALCTEEDSEFRCPHLVHQDLHLFNASVLTHF